MMTAGAANLAETVPAAMKDTVLAYADTSNMLTGITGVYLVIFLAVPFTNWYYRRLAPRFEAKDLKIAEQEAE